MTDRISGQSKSPYGVQPTPEKSTDGRVRASRTHARHHSRVDSGSVDLSSVEKKSSASAKEEVRQLVLDLASPNAQADKIAPKFAKLCKHFNSENLEGHFAAVLKDFTPKAAVTIDNNLGWVQNATKSEDVWKLLVAVRSAAEKRSQE
jgi:hypothetical protein